MVAFNTLALERGRLDATDTEFISESLVGAEALLGIVSDILARDPRARGHPPPSRSGAGGRRAAAWREPKHRSELKPIERVLLWPRRSIPSFRTRAPPSA